MIADTPGLVKKLKFQKSKIYSAFEQKLGPISKFCTEQYFLNGLESITTKFQTSISKNVGEDRFLVPKFDILSKSRLKFARVL